MHVVTYTCLLCLFLVGCGGPKIVGSDVTPAKVTGLNYAVDDPSLLRYPLSGKKIDETLYFLNQPQTIVAQQQKFNNYLRKVTAKGAPPNDYNNLQPREASPFRQ